MTNTGLGFEVPRTAQVQKVDRIESLNKQVECGVRAVEAARKMYETGNSSIANALQELHTLSAAQTIVASEGEVILIPLF